MTEPHKPTRTYSCVTKGCNHPPHREGRRAYNRLRKKRRGMGQRLYVDAGPTRAAIRDLNARGVNIPDIARSIGVSPSTLVRCINGGAKVHATTHAAVTSMLRVDQRLVPSAGTYRRLEALACLGYSAKFVCARAGLHPSTFTQGKYRDSTRVRASHAEAIARVFDELWGRPPAAFGITANTVAIVKGVARREGYTPGLAWDDIDDPNETPKGVAA